MLRTIREGDLWQLQTAAITLQHPATGHRITLLALIHIGRPDYYGCLSELIDAHQGYILYEGVGELTEGEQGQLTDHERRVYQSLAALNDAYRRIAAALHLVAQPDAMPQPAADWIRADLPARELLRRWVALRLPLIPVMNTAGDALQSTLMRRATRFMLLHEPYILSAFQFLRGHAPGLRRLTALLIDQRNTAALAAVDALTPDREMLMTYGAGHIPGLVGGLTDRGYREVAREWHTAHAERIPLTDLLDRAGPRARPNRAQGG